MSQKSLYTDEPPLRQVWMANTVGELKELLDMFPDKLPLGFDGVFLQWANIGNSHPAQHEQLIISREDPNEDDGDEDWLEDDEEGPFDEADDFCEWDDTDEEESEEDDWE